MSGLRSGQVAAAAGVNLQTLRYYERRGLLAEPRRSLGGHRLYPAEAVTVLRVIKAAQRLGFTLEEVAELLETGRHQHRGDAGLRARARAKLAEVETKIADLQIIAATLRAAVDAGCDDLVACANQSCCPIPFASLHARNTRWAVTGASPALRCPVCAGPNALASTGRPPRYCGTPCRKVTHQSGVRVAAHRSYRSSRPSWS